MFGLRLPELLLILVVVVLLFGANKLPQLGDSLGKGIRAFKKAADRGFQDDETAAQEKEPSGELPERRTPTASAPAEAKPSQRRDGDG